MKRLLLACVVVAGLVDPACNNNTSPSSTTTTTAPTVLAITPTTNVLVVGQTQTYSTANAAAGAVITWTSSHSDVLAVDSDGNATGLANGVAIITATTDANVTATLSVQVVPSYQGTWTGTVRTLACTDIAGFAANNYCTQALATERAITLTLTQTNLGIAGTITKAEPGGQVTGTITGLIGSGGDISTLTGTLTGTSGGSNVTLGVIAWNSLASGNSMSGLWAGNLTSPQVLGVATVQWALSSVSKVN